MLLRISHKKPDTIVGLYRSGHYQRKLRAPIKKIAALIDRFHFTTAA
jgi:hypothetical protein